MTATAGMPTAAANANLGRMRRTFANLANVMGGEAMLRLANFVAAVVIARNCGSAIFGTYATVLAYVTIASMLADNGLQVTAVKEIASRPEHLEVISSQLYFAKLLLFLPALAVLAIIGLVVRLSPLDWSIAALITLRTVMQSYCQMQIGILKAIDRLRLLGAIQTFHSIFLLVGMGVAYTLKGSILVILSALVAGQTLEFLAEARWLAHNGVRLVRVRLTDCLRLIHGSTSIGLTLSIQNAILRFDVIVVSLLAGASAAGVFAAAQTVIVIVYVIAWIVGSVLFPEMMRPANLRSQFDHYFRRSALLAQAVVIPGTVLAMLVAPAVMTTLFGAKFHDSGHLLFLMLPAAPFIVMNSLLMHRSMALQRWHSYLLIYGFAAVFALALNSAMVLRFGSPGVAVAVVTREVLIALSFQMAYQRFSSFHTAAEGN